MVELERQNLKDNKKIYNKIEKDLKSKLPTGISIDHVGSTAIPNMYGKNIMDILIGAKDEEEFSLIKKILEENKFIASDKSKTDVYQFFATHTGETKKGDIHIHLVIKDSERYKEFIILRNYLLNNKEEAKAYSDYKRELIKKGITERKEYKRIKGDYVTTLIARAKRNK